MSTTEVQSATSRLRLGHARVDITPPVGIYHRMWGAARHDRASGVHRPLVADVLALAPAEQPEGHGSEGPGRVVVRAYLDLVGLVRRRQEGLVAALAAASGAAEEDVLVCHSHSHSAGWLATDRIGLPGGELIPPYLDELEQKLADAGRRAVAALQAVTATYGTGRSQMAANRDYWDAERGIYTCGLNPDVPHDDTVLVARFAGDDGRTVATLVNFSCHPTTLAWENSLLSPDYPGAMRETVEQATGAPCIFAQGASGDLCPRDGYTGDTRVADRNGQQLGYAALATLLGMRPPGMDFRYDGPVVSGATLGVWKDAPQVAERATATSRFEGGALTVHLPLKPRPERAALEASMADWLRRQQDADARGEVIPARDFGARAERARRWLGRIQDLPEGDTFPMRCWVYRFGDAFWVASGGEPYSAIQVELRRRFPRHAILFSPLAGSMQVAYLLTAEAYGRGLYQEEPSILAAGCLEQLTGALAGRIAALM